MLPPVYAVTRERGVTRTRTVDVRIRPSAMRMRERESAFLQKGHLSSMATGPRVDSTSLTPPACRAQDRPV